MGTKVGELLRNFYEVTLEDGISQIRISDEFLIEKYASSIVTVLGIWRVQRPC